ncbi:MAG: ATPase domain-containing protein [Euryarchaeota archaeon]|nr:ATPase domain-containing protein [Euryarchaeota archaeon]
MKHATSNIPGLDDILNGGFQKPSAVLVAGTAGTGKTTMVMQSIYNASKKNEVCMYVTSLNEPVSVVSSFMSNHSFYDVSLISKGNISYLPIGTDTLDKGIYSFMWNLEEAIEKLKPDRIVIDPITMIGGTLDRETRSRFFYDIFLRMKKWGSLVLVTGDLTADELAKNDLGHVADGIIYLSNDLKHDHRTRHLEVLKMRGQGYLSGKHTFSITDNGITIHPETMPVADHQISDQRIAMGIAGLDQMTGGGLLSGTNTLLSGDSGTGKTCLGIHFIYQGANDNEPGIVISFDENEQQIKAAANSIGHDLEEYITSERIRVVHVDPALPGTDMHTLELETLIDGMQAKRIVLDGIQELDASLDEGSKQQYIRMLAKLFTSKGITAMFTDETDSIASMVNNRYGMDTIIAMRHDEIASCLKKTIAVLKMRRSEHDIHIRELTVTNKGIEIGSPLFEQDDQ